MLSHFFVLTSLILASAETPVLVLEPGMHNDQIVGVFFTRDDKSLITVSEDKTIRFWDIAAGKQLKVLRPPIGLGADGRIRAAALSPDGRLLAVGGFGIRTEGKRTNPTLVIDLEKEALVHTLPGSTAPVYALAFSQDGKRLATAPFNEGVLSVWDLETGKREALLKMVKNLDPRRMAFSPDGKLLAVTTMEGGDLHLFDIKTGRVGTTPNELGATHDFAWTPDGKSLVTANLGGVRLFDADGRSRLVALKDRPCSAVLVSADSRRVLVEAKRDEGGYNQAFWVDVETGKETLVSKNVGTKLALSNDAKLIAGLTGNGTAGASVFCWKSDTGESVLQLPMAGSKLSIYLNKIGWTVDGQKLALAGYASFDLVKLAAGPPLDPKELRGAIAKIGDLEWRTAGRHRFEMFKGDKSLYRVEMKGGNFPSHTLMDAERMVVGTNQGDIELYHATEGGLVRTCAAHNDAVGAVVPSPNGKLILSFANSERIACVWNPLEDRPLLYVRITPAKTKKDASYEWLAWTPDGYYACSPAAENWFGWHLDRGPEKMAGFANTEEMRRMYHQPDLIRKRLERFLAK